MEFQPLRALSIQRICRSNGLDQRDFKGWISTGRYQVNTIDRDSNIELHVNDMDFYSETLAYDFSRFACAAFESMREINSDSNFPKATAWAAIKTYYAAFFAAHSILRYFGVSCSQLENRQAQILNSYASIYNITEKAGLGFYTAVLDEQTNNLTLNKMKDTHKDTWTAFNNKLKELSRNILTVPGLSSEKANISTLLTNISNSIEDHGKLASGNWLSIYRNNINYKQEYFAWYPYKKNSIDFKQAEKYIKNWPSTAFNPAIGLLERDERLRFFGTCSAIIHLLHAIAKDIESLSSKSSVHKTRTARLASMA